MFRLINLVVLFCILSFIYCLVNIGEIQLYTISLLPFTFFLFTISLSKLYKSYSNSFVFKIFIFQVIIRYCILPALISTDQAFILKYDLFYLNIAILVMILELLFVLLVFTFFSKKHRYSYMNQSRNVIPIYNGIVLPSILILLLYYVYVTGTFDKINLIWNLDDYVSKYVTGDEELGDLGFGVISFNLLKSLIALYFISIIYRMNGIKSSLKKWLYFLVIITAGIFIIGTSRFSLLLFILPLLVLISYLLNNTDYRILFRLTSVLVGLALIVTTIAKFTRNGNIVSTDSVFSAESINAYFAGMGNIAIGLKAYEKNRISESFLYLFNDTFQNVPILSNITSDYYKTTLRFNEEIYGHSLYADQIVPLSISGLFHFSFVGMIFYSSFFISIALLMERISYKTDFIAYKYLFIYLSINISLVYMLNLGSFYGSIIGSFIFLFLPFLFMKNSQKLRFK